ncbi:MAG TPA: carboxypeptidase regulatory-like domain-containing protein [Pseudomonas sp.]|nr:carboxypeptidase regulatory-like domain-containing protein [Pseudomonas sp.]
MITVHMQTLSRVALAMLLGFSPLALHAADEAPADMSAVQLVPKEQNGITYLSGGIGEDESQAMKQVKGYNLHMTFSAGAANDYLSGVDVVITTVEGRSIVSLSQVGPIVYVKLPAGKYLVVASQNGREKRSTVALDGTKTGTVNLHWGD